MAKRWKRRELRFGKEKKRINYDILKSVFDWMLQIILVCVFAFVFVWYFGQRVSVIGDSMNPILENGDVVVINRIIYNASSPKRGDVIVFQPNGNENAVTSTKRIIGLPGEMIRIENNQIFINGEILEESYETSEILNEGVAKEEIQLGGDEYFVMGDNRKSSEDSRMPDIGNVKKEEIEGKAWFIVAPWEHFGSIKRK